jgi:hypothetical protein
MYRPSARRDELTVREMADETVIYDHKTNQAHCLNRSTAFIWRQCDGTVAVEELADLVRKRLAIEPAEAVVQLALVQLSRRNLLKEPLPPAVEHGRMGRRAMLKKLAAAASLPLAFSVAVKSAHAAPPPAAACGAICSYDGSGKLINTITAGCSPTTTCQTTCPSTGTPNGSAIVPGRCV